MIETGATVLEKAATNPDAEVDTAHMRHLVDEKADVGPEDLAYEDWISPREHTDGRSTMTDMHFAPTISAHLPNVEPVLRENTPFAESDS